MAVGKYCSVSDFVGFVRRQVDVARASSDPAQPVAGPLYLVLVGSGFTLSAGMPSTQMLALAIHLWKQARLTGSVKRWPEVFDEALLAVRRQRWEKAHPGADPPGELRDTADIPGKLDYYALMDEVLDSERSRHKFITSAIQWSNESGQVVERDGSTSPGQIVNSESILLASLLMAATPGSAGQRPLDPNSGALALVFARCCCTTNFDEVLPAAFHLCNQPVDIVDTRSPRAISDSPEYPTVIYLHGRHLNYDLRNTPQEVGDASVAEGRADYDPLTHFRHMLRGTLGLLVIGYSGAEQDGLILRFIREALEQQGGLQGGLWWHCHHGPASISPQARQLIRKYKRAHFITHVAPDESGQHCDAEGPVDSERFMTALVDNLGLDSGAAVMSWFARGDRIRRRLSGSLKLVLRAIRQFSSRAEESFDNYSREALEQLLQDWRGGVAEQVEQLVDKEPGDCGTAMNWAARLMLSCYEYDVVLPTFERALECHVAAGDRTGQGTAELGRGDTLRRLDRITEALDAYDAALEHYTAAGDRIGQGKALCGRGDALMRLYRATDALEAFEGAFEQHSIAGNRRGQGDSLAGKGNALVMLGRADEALAFHEASLEHHCAVESRIGQGDALYSQGFTLRNLRRAAAALVACDAALEHHSAIGDRMGQGRAQMGRGDALLDLDRPSEGLAAYKAALEHYSITGSRLGQGNAQHGHGNALLRLGRTEEAVTAYKTALEHHTAAGDKVWQSYDQVERGNALLNLHRFKKALIAYETPFELPTGDYWISHRAYRLRSTAWCLLLLKRPTDALLGAEEAFAIDPTLSGRLMLCYCHWLSGTPDAVARFREVLAEEVKLAAGLREGLAILQRHKVAEPEAVRMLLEELGLADSSAA